MNELTYFPKFIALHFSEKSNYIPYSAIFLNYMSWKVHKAKISHVLSTVPESQGAKYGHK